MLKTSEIVMRVRRKLRSFADKKRAKLLLSFFKTGPGQYGEGDVFIGLTVPHIREVAAAFKDKVVLNDIRQLIKSKVHEERLLALIMLVGMFADVPAGQRAGFFKFYLKNSRHINNWDLVDLSAPRIVGAYLWDRPRGILYKLARSQDLWERRIAIVATAYLINKNDFSDTLNIARILLTDKHDLIHKASGWMLREVGKRDRGVLEQFLDQHAVEMPRTMLRYSIERFPQNRKSFYMRKKSK
jgi:3-methyladenine DNA glycosylase AlkD